MHSLCCYCHFFFCVCVCMPEWWRTTEIRVRSYWQWFSLKPIFCVQVFFICSWSLIVMQQQKRVYIYIWLFYREYEKNFLPRALHLLSCKWSKGYSMVCPLFNYNQLKCILSITFMGSRKIMYFSSTLLHRWIHARTHINTIQLRQAEKSGPEHRQRYEEANTYILYTHINMADGKKKSGYRIQ